MGLDYSYVLRFRRSQIREVLLAIVDRAEPSPTAPMEVILPGGDSVLLPFRYLPPLQPPVALDGRYPLSFCVSFWFVPDAPLEHYAAAVAAAGHPLPRDAQGRIAYGCIWLSMYMKPTRNNPDLEFIDFDFTPATRQMSMVFAASESIRRFFVQLLEEHKGIRGQFEDSDCHWGPITVWPETDLDYNPTNLLELHNRLAPDTPYYRFPLGY